MKSQQFKYFHKITLNL